MTTIILLILAFIAVAFLFDAVRQSKKKAAPVESTRSERMLTADEAGPTETGRFRVQQALGTGSMPPAARPQQSPIGPNVVADEEQDPLPDPFEPDKH
ncbi:MAG: hypothetical protein KDD69_01840 [Bdellovibrionales bacterium]|nr:hypothetical protein [Bdellovibrionales bacterium]